MFNRSSALGYYRYPSTQRTSELKKLYREIRKILGYFKAENFSEGFEYSKALFFSLGGAGINNATPYLWLQVHQYLVEQSATEDQDKKDKLQNYIYIGMGMVASTMLVRSLFDVLRSNAMAIVSQDAAAKLRRDITRKVLHPRAKSDHAGQLQMDLSESTDSLNNFGQGMLGNMLPWMLEIVVAGSILVAEYGYEYGLYMLAYVIMYFTVTVQSSAVMSKVENDFHDLEQMSEVINIESLGHKEELNLYGLSERQLDLQDKLSAEVRAYTKKMQFYGFLSPVLQHSLTALYLYANFQSYVSRSPTVNDLVLFTAYPITFTAFFNSIGDAYNNFRFSQKKLNDLLEAIEDHLKEINANSSTEPAVVIPIEDNNDSHDAIELTSANETVLIQKLTRSEMLLEWMKEFQPLVAKTPTVNPALELRNFTFGWRNGGNVGNTLFENADLQLTSGGIIALVSANGAGKSSFIKLLTNKEDPVEGEVLVNGKPLNEIDVASTFSVAPQKSVNFKGSFLYNLRFANPHADEDKMNHYITKFNLQRFKNIDEVIDDNDKNVTSEGQTQIMSAIRTLLRSDADIFIFDETASNLDPNYKDILMTILQELAKEKIVIFCLHDIEMIGKYCNKVVFINNKKFTLDTHANLINSNLEYMQYFRQSDNAKQSGSPVVANNTNGLFNNRNSMVPKMRIPVNTNTRKVAAAASSSTSLGSSSSPTSGP